MMKFPDSQLSSNPEVIIVAFYLSQRPDSRGRRIEEIWLWDYQRLEDTHDYIQWLFPLEQKSRFNPAAPVLNKAAIQSFRTNEQLRIRLRQSLEVMLRFYGLQFHESGSTDIEISQSDEYQERKKVWLNPRNHNYLRLTRILTSLKLLGLENHAQALFKCLSQIYEEEGNCIGSETYAFWKNAVK